MLSITDIQDRLFVSKMKSLKQPAGVTGIEKYDTTKGEESDIGSALLDAIQKSHICIIVFSENYDSSTWYVAELVSILEWEKMEIQKHEKDYKLPELDVKSWRACLKQAASVCGIDCETKDNGILREIDAKRPLLIIDISKGLLMRVDMFVTLRNAYVKIDHPSLADVVWRLKKKGKHRKVHLQLSPGGIAAVQDLSLLCKVKVPSQEHEKVLLEETNKNPPRGATSAPQLYEKRKEVVARFSSSLVTLTFPLLLFSTMLMNPLNKTHGSQSILLALLAMFNFMVFASALSVMIAVGAKFTKIQMILLVISAIAMHVVAPSLLFMVVEVPILIILLAM